MAEYYIVSLKHTSKGDTALTFWGANGSGYTWDRKRAGIYQDYNVDEYISEDSVKVEKEKVDAFWMNAVDFGDKYVAVANTSAVCFELNLNQSLMKPKKSATCRMSFLNTPVTHTPLRKPGEMTEADIAEANEFLPAGWYYIPRDNILEVVNNKEDGTSEIGLSDLKKFFDYLTSINVNPYAD
jgi:hypothetical protein